MLSFIQLDHQNRTTEYATEYNDFEQEAITSVVMKCFDKCVLPMLKADVSRLDPIQLYYRRGPGMDDAINSIMYLI